MLNWANRFNICCFLDNNGYQSSHHKIECLLGAGAVHSLSADAGNALNQLQAFGAQHQDWMFGHLGYDLKNETELLTSTNPDKINFPDLFFFVPSIVVELTLSTMRIGTVDIDPVVVYHEIINIQSGDPITDSGPADDLNKKIEIHERYTRDEYLQTIIQLQKHILRGDCYEINFCQEFYAENIGINPVEIFIRLGRLSPNPFSAFYKIDDKYLICASPERYLKKDGARVISQPIKGTLKRIGNNEELDAAGRQRLLASEKDRSENVMVVDLVRNDLSRICMEGSVKVDELFGVYNFPQVYQMISTISGELKSELDWVEVIRATFPMGSMTGAPKQNVLRLIEKYERTARGIFSGAIGYVSPEKDFDFNVVIRSLIYNQSTRYLSFPAGSGITFYSNPEAEYEECLLKVAAIRKILQ
ncbi:MAG: anthranilate synthase component I family protein [Chitinophagaceae bacterium]|nr:MAG: anthranilate synthase component I family protein [Chitinophagaceae bacterium]